MEKWKNLFLSQGQILEIFNWKARPWLSEADQQRLRWDSGQCGRRDIYIIQLIIIINYYYSAVFVWSGNEKIYFFKGSKYWKFDPEKRPPVDREYPRQISNWDGIPNDIDDALQYDNGFTYFFKGGQYYRFDDMKFKVDNIKSRYDNLH